MGILIDKGIVRHKSKSTTIFERLMDDNTFLDVEYAKPSEYIVKYWREFKKLPGSKNGLNGKIFELIIQTLLYRENISPFYIQANVAFVPNVKYDTLLYNKEFVPISLSMKTSLRERYKQADLEAIALKYVHRKAKCILLTVEEKEAKNVKEKIKTGDVIGLDTVVLCTSFEMDDLITELKKVEFTEAGSIEIVTGQIVVNKDKEYGINRK